MMFLFRSLDSKNAEGWKVLTDAISLCLYFMNSVQNMLGNMNKLLSEMCINILR